MFCNNGRLSKIYRCYNNEHDNIHLGSLVAAILIKEVMELYSFSKYSFHLLVNFDFEIYFSQTGKLNAFERPIRPLHANIRADVDKNLDQKPKQTLFILTLTFLMITIVNCSLLNPGPEQFLGPNNEKGFSVYYQNVQGLIPFTELSKKHPSLDYTKIAEIHAYINEKHPDVIVLNETWLKSSILDEEIFPIR